MTNYKENRPWGSFEVLIDSISHKVKQIIVSPKARLSLQSHQFRREHWYIVQGLGEVTLNDKIIKLASQQSIEIPIQAKHRIANIGNDDLIFIEVQTGQSFDENDITRYQDDYQRT